MSTSLLASTKELISNPWKPDSPLSTLSSPLLYPKFYSPETKSVDYPSAPRELVIWIPFRWQSEKKPSTLSVEFSRSMEPLRLTLPFSNLKRLSLASMEKTPSSSMTCKIKVVSSSLSVTIWLYHSPDMLLRTVYRASRDSWSPRFTDVINPRWRRVDSESSTSAISISQEPTLLWSLMLKSSPSL